MSKEFVKYKLPKNWVWTTIGKLGIVASGGTPSTRERRYWDGDIPWITPADLTGYKEKYISKGRRFITEDGLEESSAKLLPKGTILFSSRAPIGYVAIAKNEIATNQGFKNLILTKWTNPDYIFYYLKSATQLAQNMASGTTFLELSATKFAQIPIPLPPLKEQNRIIIKLEEALSELEKGIEILQELQNQISLYKHSLFKSTFNGEMTKDYRSSNEEDSVSTLVRSLKTSRVRDYESRISIWNAEFKKWKSNGSKGKKPIKPYPIKEVTPANASKLQDKKLPKEWQWIKIGEICTVVRGGSPRPAGDPKFYNGKIPFLKVADITKDDNMYLNSYDNTIKEAGLSKTREIKENTLLLTNSGATLGVPKICAIKATINDGIAALLGLEGITISYLYYYLKSQTEMLRSITQGSGQPNLNTDIISNLHIPFCGLEEQNTIVSLLETQLSNIEVLERTIVNELRKSDILLSSILKKAFQGAFIDQDTTEGSAIEYLNLSKEEIKKYKIKSTEDKKHSKKRKIMNSPVKTIEEVLKSSTKPISAKEVWEQSKHKDDIEAFYAELKKLQGKVKEVEKGMLAFTNES